MLREKMIMLHMEAYGRPEMARPSAEGVKYYS